MTTVVVVGTGKASALLGLLRRQAGGTGAARLSIYDPRYPGEVTTVVRATANR